MKGIRLTLAIFVSCFSLTCFAASCPKAEPTNSPKFCPSFKDAALCYCKAAGLPSSVCQSVKDIYNRLIATFGSIKAACEYQHDTTTQNCIDGWNCYMNGGKDSQGNLCSSTGKACE